MKEVNFPVGGGSSGFTYSYANCVGTPTTLFELADPSVSSWLSLAQTTTNLTITASAAPASLISPRTARVNIKVNGTSCENYFSITQAGNACSCSTALVTGASTVAIPQTGGTNIEVGTYTANTNCITVNATGSVNPEAASWVSNVSVANGKVKATLTPNYNASRPATITISGTMKNDSSICTKTIPITQPGLSCTCTTAFNVAAGTVTQAGSAGASVQIGTYTTDASCIQSVASAGSSSQGWITGVTVSGGKIYGVVSANTGAASRTTTISVSATMKNGTVCPKTFELIQPGLSCSCSTAFTASSVSITSAGGANIQVGSYYAAPNCITAVTSTATVTPSSATAWLPQAGVSVSGGQVKAYVSGNTTTSSRSGTITITSKLNDGSTCTATVAVSQPGVACSCGSIVIDEVKPIPQTGLTSGSLVGKYKCGTSTCNWCDTWSAVLSDGTNNYNCTVSLTNATSFTVSLASGVSVPANDNQSGDAKDFTLAINNGGTNCLNDLLIQNGLANCTCEGLIDQEHSMVHTVETVFQSDGTSGSYAIFVSGNTHGCGELSATTSSPMIASTFRVTHPGSNPELYYWEGVVDSYTGHRTADINFYYKDRHGEWLDCNQYVMLEQGDGICGCPSVDTSNIPSTITLPNGDGFYPHTGANYYPILSVNGTMKSYPIPGSYYSGFCQAVVAKYVNGTAWALMDSYYKTDQRLTDIGVSMSKNKTGQPREQKFTLIVLSNPNDTMDIISPYYAGNRGWRWNNSYESEYEYTSCFEKEITLIQPVRTPCSCANANLQIYSDYHDTQGLFEFTASAQTKEYSYTVDCGRLESYDIYDYNDETRVIPSSEVAIYINHDTYVSERYDDSGDIEVIVGRNDSGSDKLYRIDLHLSAGTDTCTESYYMTRFACNCTAWGDAFRAPEVVIESGEISACTIFEAPCTSSTQYWNVSITPSLGCSSWLNTLTVTRDSSSILAFKICAVAKSRNYGAVRSCYSTLSIRDINNSNCTTRTVNITQKTPSSACDECREQMGRDYTSKTTYIGWETAGQAQTVLEFNSGASCYAGTGYQTGMTYVALIDGGQDADKFTITTGMRNGHITVLLTPLYNNESGNDYKVNVKFKFQHLEWQEVGGVWQWVPVDHYDAYGNQCNETWTVRQSYKSTPQPTPCDSCTCVPRSMPDSIFNITAPMEDSVISVPKSQTNYSIGTMDLSYISDHCGCDNDCSCIGVGVTNASSTFAEVMIDSAGNMTINTGDNGQSTQTYSVTIYYTYNGSECSGSASKIFRIKLI